MVFNLASRHPLLVDQHEPLVGEDEVVANELVGVLNGLAWSQNLGEVLLNRCRIDLGCASEHPIKETHAVHPLKFPLGGYSKFMTTPTKEELVSSLRQVLGELETGKLRSGSWREQYVASAVGLIASGCYAEAATHVAQARAMSSVPTRQGSAPDLLRGLEVVARDSSQ